MNARWVSVHEIDVRRSLGKRVPLGHLEKIMRRHSTMSLAVSWEYVASGTTTYMCMHIVRVYLFMRVLSHLHYEALFFSEPSHHPRKVAFGGYTLFSVKAHPSTD
jgi:hypothetical protein